MTTTQHIRLYHLSRCYAAMLLCIAMQMLASCRTRYVPVETTHYRDSVHVVHATDSVYRLDSVIVYQRGDTLRIRERSVDHYYHTIIDRSQHRDSISPPSIDSELLAQIITSEVNRKIALLQPKHRPWLYWIGVATSLLLYLLYRLARKKLKIKLSTWKT